MNQPERITDIRLVGSGLYGAVVYFTEATGNSTFSTFGMNVMYHVQYGRVMNNELRKLKWTPLEDIGYAAMWRN